MHKSAKCIVPGEKCNRGLVPGSSTQQQCFILSGCQTRLTWSQDDGLRFPPVSIVTNDISFCCAVNGRKRRSDRTIRASCSQHCPVISWAYSLSPGWWPSTKTMVCFSQAEGLGKAGHGDLVPVQHHRTLLAHLTDDQQGEGILWTFLPS